MVLGRMLAILLTATALVMPLFASSSASVPLPRLDATIALPGPTTDAAMTPDGSFMFITEPQGTFNNGTRLLLRQPDGTTSEIPAPASSFHAWNAVVSTTNNHFIASYCTHEFPSSSPYHGFLICFDHAGAQLWQSHVAHNGDDDIQLTVGHDGLVYIFTRPWCVIGYDSETGAGVRGTAADWSGLASRSLSGLYLGFSQCPDGRFLVSYCGEEFTWDPYLGSQRFERVNTKLIQLDGTTLTTVEDLGPNELWDTTWSFAPFYPQAELTDGSPTHLQLRRDPAANSALLIRDSRNGTMLGSISIAAGGGDPLGYRQRLRRVDATRFLCLANNGELLLFSQDRDEDGITDEEESFGFDMGSGLPAWKPAALGLDPNHQNLLVEIDGMAGRCPRDQDLLAVKGLFESMPNSELRQPNPDGRDGVTFHYELGTTGLPRTVWGPDYRQQFLLAKRDHFADAAASPLERRARERIFRYCFFADQLPNDWTGDATNQGQNVICALGAYLTDEDYPNPNRRKAFQGILAHELGHTLGLAHGGNGSLINYKPNYHSVMNYLWLAPTPGIENSWRLTYARDSLPTLDERSLIEADGLGGTPQAKTLIGDVPLGARSLCAYQGQLIRDRAGNRLEIVPSGGAVDFDWNCEPNRAGRALHARIQEPEVRNARQVLPGARDLNDLDLRMRDGFGQMFGASTVVEAAGVELALSASLWRDCDEDGISDWDEVSTGALDIDCNGTPDNCEAGRIAAVPPIGPMCPGGDGDTLVVDIHAGDICIFDSTAFKSAVFLLLAPASDPSFRLWRETNLGWIPTDTAWATSYDAQAGQARIVVRRLSGCGQLSLTVRVGAADLGTIGPYDIASFDRDAHSVGSVDHFDQEHWATGLFGGQQGTRLRCFDLDGDGLTTGADLSLLSAHLGHAIPRVVSFPNGTEAFTYGEFREVSWAPGWGDSSRVSLRLFRDSQPEVEHLIAEDAADDGRWLWPVYVTDAPGWDYRIRVTHTAGAPTAGNVVGTDVSDGPFFIDAPAGDGCPTVEALTPYGWVTENTVLGRSLSGVMGLDAYHTRWLGGRDTLLYLRVYEKEQESTLLDQVRLVSIDHRPGVLAFATGERVLLGTRKPPLSVRTASGRDITAETSGSGPGFDAAAGETLEVERSSTVHVGALAAGATSDGDPLLIDDGGGKGGGVPLLTTGPAEAASVDAQVLTTTGILVQVPNGEGGWESVAHYYPRERASETLLDAVRASRVRLVFLDEHLVRFLGSLQVVSDSLEATKLPLVRALHSRLGDVFSAVSGVGNLTTTVEPGDTLTMVFKQDPPPDNRVRDYFLLSRGVYSSNLPARQRPRESPTNFRLYPARPNPAFATTQIGFDVPIATRILIEVFDVQGRHVRTIVDRHYDAGVFSVGWDRRGDSGAVAPAGVYLVRFSAGPFRAETKLVVL